MGFPCGSAGKESACNVGDLGSFPGLGRFPGEGKGYPLLYSGLENSMDGIVHGVAKSRTRLSHFHFHFDHTDLCPFVGSSSGITFFPTPSLTTAPPPPRISLLAIHPGLGPGRPLLLKERPPTEVKVALLSSSQVRAWGAVGRGQVRG